MRKLWYEIRLSLAIELLLLMSKVAPQEKNGLIIICGAGQIAEELAVRLKQRATV
jgi:hypothetical protein